MLARVAVVLPHQAAAAIATTRCRPVAAAGAAARPGAVRRAPSLQLLAKKGANQGKQIKKADLPSKVCVTCGRPFTWRKRWQKVWDEVRYCSDRCKRGSKAPAAGSSGSGDAAGG
jgi:hypothetical protein